MKALVIYDSQFGNTEKVAQAIHQTLNEQAESTLLRAAEATGQKPAGYDLLIVGSPTQRFHATAPIDAWLTDLSLQGVRAAAFDTRFDMAEVESRVLRLAVKVAGDSAAYAAPRIAAELEKAGATLVAPPEGFIVEDTEGPLKAGELERAARWADQIVAKTVS